MHGCHEYHCHIFILKQPLKKDKFVIPKSRFDTIDMYLANPEYNDKEVLYDDKVFQQLKDGGKWLLIRVSSGSITSPTGPRSG